MSLLIRAFVPNPGVAGLPLCKYYPTCSEYSTLAYREFGPIRGTWLTRVAALRCNPWSERRSRLPGESSRPKP